MPTHHKIEVLATGLSFPESPAFDSDGQLWFTELKAGCLTCLQPGGGLRRIVAGGNVNGMAFDAIGNIWFTDSEGHRLRRYHVREGRFQDELDSIQGRRLSRPNDLAFAPNGSLVFSCHADGRTQPLGYLAVRTAGGSGRIISANKFFTNGIVFSSDGKRIYFSETYKQRIWRGFWDDATSTILDEHPWVETGGPIGPDGLALDSEENLYAAIFDQSCVAVISPAGKVLDTISLPVKRPTSCAFDPTGRRLVVTDAEKGWLLAVETVRCGGGKLFYG